MYPVLNNRPIDQWKVTELKDELCRRELPVIGLKDDLVKRLAEALQGEVIDSGEELVGGTPPVEDQKEDKTLVSTDASGCQASTEQNILESLDDLTLVRYLIKWIPSQSWANGEVYLYSPSTHDWSSKGMKMKFFILDEKYNSEAQNIYKKVDKLITLANHSILLTPISALHEKRINRIILCYPKFDQLLKNWLPCQVFRGRFIPPLWLHLIRDVLSCITSVEGLDESLGNIDSYVLETKPERIKIILFPFEPTKGQWRADFASFLMEHLHTRWESTMFNHFMKMLQADNKIEDLVHHPLLEDFDSISNMIQMTWRESKHVDAKAERKILLSSTIHAIRNNIPWPLVITVDPVVKGYLKGATDDSFGLFTVIKKIAAHYIQNSRIHNTEEEVCGENRKHPVEIIKETWPGAIDEIYDLSLESRWLST